MEHGWQPPSGRRRHVVGDVLARVEAMRARETAAGRTPAQMAGDLLGLARDVILLLKDLAVDPRVPRREKVLAALAVAYLVSPLDLIPDIIPVIGQADDLGVAVLAVGRLLRVAGYDVIYEKWRGTDEGLALLLTLAGVQ